MDINETQKVHFIGIGGIGISAIARLFLLQGKDVSGSDVDDSEITAELQKSGAKIYRGHNADHVAGDADLVVYSIAVPGDNPELLRAKELGISMRTYPEVLGELSKEKYTVAVSGVHGKTTTTAMISEVLADSNLDPTVIVGSILKDKKSNLIVGKGEHLIVEACEYKRSFLNLDPNVVVITNIDNDHLDYYRDINDIQSAFVELVSKIPKDGFLICDVKGDHMTPVIEEASCEVIDYREEKIDARLKVPGAHNVLNAQAAQAVAKVLGIESGETKRALADFEGTWRRFESKGETKKGVKVYDDYAHHPTEIRATLRAAKENFPKSKVAVIFQPHLYSRTRKLLPEFSESFSDADEVFILPVYKAREEEDKNFRPKTLVDETRKHHPNAKFVQNFDNAAKEVGETLGKGDVLITMGAGDVYKLAEILVS